jgi:L-fucose mutarotase
LPPPGGALQQRPIPPAATASFDGSRRRTPQPPIASGAVHQETRMLIDLDPVLTPDLLWVLAAMGHGDDLALVNANFPADTIARKTTSAKLVSLPGLPVERVARAIFSVLPLDGFVADPLRRMEPIGRPDETPPVQEAVLAAARRRNPEVEFGGIERFAFYEAAARGFAVVHVGDPRPFGCFMIRKGVIFA